MIACHIPRSRVRSAWLLFALICVAWCLTGACKEEGLVSLKLASGGGQDLGKVSTLSFHFNGNGLVETPKPFQVSVDEGTAKIPSLSIDDKSTDPYFGAQVFGLDNAGKVVAYGAGRLPLISKSFEFTLFLSITEQFARLTKFDSPNTDNLMSQSIVGHQIVPLNDGRILIAGGVTQYTENKGLIGIDLYKHMVRNLLIYDPSTGIFDTGPQLGNSRAFHSATLLADGRVLLAGGLSYISSEQGGTQTWNLVALRTFEIYDPKDESLVLGAGPMAKARAFHTASLLKDGTVLIAGGLGAPIHDLAKEIRSGQVVTKLELYRPDTRDGGQEVGELAPELGRFLHGAVVMSEEHVVIVGGMGINPAGDRVVQDKSLMLKRGSDQRWTWRILPDAAKPRYDFSLVKATFGDNTWAIAVGGRNKDNLPVQEIDIYRADGRMFAGGNLQVPRYGHAATFMRNQKMLVLGGMDAAHKPVLKGEVFEVSEGGDALKLAIQNASPTLNSPQGRYKTSIAASAYDARIFVVGGATLQSEGTEPLGHTFQGINTAELYTPMLPLPADK